MIWWTTFLERWNADPWWVLGTLILFGVLVGFYAFSFFRQLKNLAWFYAAGLLGALGYFTLSLHLPLFLEWLTSVRSDWSLAYVVQTMSFQSVVSELVLYHLYFGFLGASGVLILVFFALVTFQWKRLKVFFQRSHRESWFIVFFSLLTFFFHRLLAGVLNIRIEMMVSVLQIMGFLFVFQLMMRLLDNARLESPRIFLEFYYAVGLGFLFLRFFFVGTDWFSSLGSIHTLFFEQLFVFFLVLLMIGFLITFALRAFFLSPFSFAQFRPLFPLLKRSKPSDKDSYVNAQLAKGLFISMATGMIFLLFVFQGWILPLLMLFFAGYFLLFYLLDHLEDLKTKGDLVTKRVESSHNKSFLNAR